ncbi:MAG: transaldolase family protein [Armatimonadota bacterium]
MTDAEYQVLLDLMFRVPPDDFETRLTAWRDELAAEYPRASDDRQDQIAGLVAENTIDLGSVLADWNLTNKARQGEKTLDPCALATQRETNLGLLRQWGRQDLVSTVEEELASLAASNLARLARMTLAGETNTYWGNDYAANLYRAMRRGACLVTTNPVLVNVARTEAPAYWTPIRDQLREQHPSYNPVELAYTMTVQVVVSNARLLRPLWELTEGRIGYVSLQLSPKQATDAEAMIKEARWCYAKLEEELGGTPNTVFKLPGTKAGIDACCQVTSEGMGVNITVNFSLPQQIAFAGAIEANSTAPVSFRTQMDGRVDDPVGEELRDLGVADWEEVKTWCTTAIRQREYRMLCHTPQGGGLGLTKANPLPASGRGPWNILRSINDGPVPIFITIFPDKQEQFDSEPRELNPRGLWTPVPEEMLARLMKSKLFRMAYEPDGMNVDEFDDYVPVVRTLSQFAASYDEFVAWVAG